MTKRPATLDHIVVNALHGMDAAADMFTELGFTVTPRGYHSLGSINNLMMTSGAYLELVGLPDTGPQRQDVLDGPFGLNGLVLASDNADDTYARLTEAGFAPSAPVAFSRPVSIGGERVEAKFRTVRIPAPTFPAGRVYFCEHLTPEYVWRPEWLDHPNGFRAIDGLVVSSRTPEAEAVRYGELCATRATPCDDGWRMKVGTFSIEIVDGEETCFSSLGLVFEQLDDLARRARALPDIEWRSVSPNEASLTVASLRLRLECRTAS